MDPFKERGVQLLGAKFSSMSTTAVSKALREWTRRRRLWEAAEEAPDNTTPNFDHGDEDVASIDEELSNTSGGFGILLSQNVPHIFERIFFALDYESFKTCHEVCITWYVLLTSEPLHKRAKHLYSNEIHEDEKRLLEASKKGDADEVVRLLSSVLVDVNCIGGYYDSTPLCEAASRGHVDLVKILLDRGGDPNKADIDGETPLYRIGIQHCRRKFVGKFCPGLNLTYFHIV